VILLGALVVSGAIVAGLAFAAPPAAPTISSKPPNPSATTSASFSFSGASGSTFECRLDGAPSFTGCTSPKSYTGLALGSHTFRVRAKKGTDTSAETTYTWSIVVPTATITAGPTGNVSSQSASFSFTANASNATFECKLDGAASFTACTSPKSYSALAQGSHTFRVRAVGSAGTGAEASRAFFVDSVAPTKPVFTQTPPNPSTTATSTFAWSSTDPAPASGINRSECSKENGAYVTCTSPHTYAVQTTNNGTHQFAVRTIDNAGNVSQVASFSWKVDKGSPQNFTITGTVGGLVPSNVFTEIPVAITNPNSETLYVTSLNVSIAGVPGCDASNFATQAWSAPPKIAVPATSSYSPPAGRRPAIRLKNLAGNQDSCKNKSFTLTFTGSGTNDPS
jgi:hypothetical protein